jgi:capsular exopolysaccharide synthesis family protein
MNSLPHNDDLPAIGHQPNVPTPWLAKDDDAVPLEPPERGLREWLVVLRKRRSLVATVTLFFLGAAVIYCAFTPPLYTAKTTIEIRGHAPVIANLQSEALLGADTRKIEYQKTTVAKLTLEGLADQVLSTDSLALELDDYWRSRRSLIERAYATVSAGDARPHSNLIATDDKHFLHRPSIIRKYLSLIDVTPVHETNLVTIQATTSNAELSQRVANAHALGFIRHLQNERREATMNNVSLLQRQAAELKARVTDAENELSKYAASNRLLTVRQDEASGVNIRQIESLSSLLAESVGRRIKSESLLHEAQGKRADESSVADDEVTRQLRVSLAQAETEYATQNSRLMGPHPVMLELKAKVDSLKKALGDERRRSLRTIQAQFEAEKAGEARLRSQIEQERSAAQETAQRLIQYNVLSKEASSLRDLYQAVIRQAKEVEISAATATSNVFVTDYASLPGSPSAPRTGVILVLFSIVGLSFGVFAAFVAEALQDTLGSADDVEAALLLPILGSVPSFIGNHAGSLAALPAPPPLTEQPEQSEKAGTPQRTSSSLPPAKRLLVASGSREPVSEALRTLRASILLSSADHPPRIVMVSSAAQAEGKTTIVSNLAAILTQGGYRVALIDGDLRLSGLTKIFSESLGETTVGLTDLLTGQTSLEQALRTTSVPGLDIIPAGNQAPDPAELLGSQRMRELTRGLTQRYDFVLIDSPPILPVADSLMLSRVVDSVVMVVRSTHTDRKQAQEARRRLIAVHARILGVVLNDVELGAGGGRGYYGY